jgi:hypothetical protein
MSNHLQSVADGCPQNVPVAAQHGKGAPKRNRHGLTALMSRVKIRGLAVIDMRTSAARELMRWKAELLRDLGGEENISTQRLALVDMAVRTRLFLSHIDAFLLAQSSLVNKRHRTVLPILRDRMTLSDQLARLLSQLGLDRADTPVQSLAKYVEEKSKVRS